MGESVSCMFMSSGSNGGKLTTTSSYSSGEKPTPTSLVSSSSSTSTVHYAATTYKTASSCSVNYMMHSNDDNKNLSDQSNADELNEDKVDTTEFDMYLTGNASADNCLKFPQRPQIMGSQPHECHEEPTSDIYSPEPYNQLALPYYASTDEKIPLKPDSLDNYCNNIESNAKMNTLHHGIDTNFAFCNDGQRDLCDSPSKNEALSYCSGVLEDTHHDLDCRMPTAAPIPLHMNSSRPTCVEYASLGDDACNNSSIFQDTAAGVAYVLRDMVDD